VHIIDGVLYSGTFVKSRRQTIG